MKIRTVIFGAYVAASALGLVVLMRFMLAEVRPRYVNAVRSNLEDSTRLMAVALAGRSAADAVKALSGPATFRIKLMGADGQVWFDSAASAASQIGDEATPVRRVVKRTGSRLIDGPASLPELEVSATASFTLADGATAQLVLSRSFRNVNAVIWSERMKLSLIAVLIAGVMVIAGWWIAARLTHSLERLTAYARGVRDGRLVVPPRSRVTEIAALGGAFEEMRDALEGRQHVERYTQALAHEVKAPLAAIRGAAELLGEEMPLEQRARFLGNIRSESARIQQSIDRLLELSSLEARKTLQQVEPIDAASLMTEAADVVRPAYAVRGVTLQVTTAPVALCGERVLLREALVNLLQNALDFSPSGGLVTLGATVTGGRVVWTVEDNGPGVPDYALPRVFERFYSLPRPGTARKSTGLGLALVREIAHLHGGEAMLVNRPEGGARARLALPASI